MATSVQRNTGILPVPEPVHGGEGFDGESLGFALSPEQFLEFSKIGRLRKRRSERSAGHARAEDLLRVDQSVWTAGASVLMTERFRKAAGRNKECLSTNRRRPVLPDPLEVLPVSPRSDKRHQKGHRHHFETSISFSGDRNVSLEALEDETIGFSKKFQSHVDALESLEISTAREAMAAAAIQRHFRGFLVQQKVNSILSTPPSEYKRPHSVLNSKNIDFLATEEPADSAVAASSYGPRGVLNERDAVPPVRWRAAPSIRKSPRRSRKREPSVVDTFIRRTPPPIPELVIEDGATEDVKKSRVLFPFSGAKAESAPETKSDDGRLRSVSGTGCSGTGGAVRGAQEQGEFLSPQSVPLMPLDDLSSRSPDMGDGSAHSSSRGDSLTVARLEAMLHGLWGEIGRLRESMAQSKGFSSGSPGIPMGIEYVDLPRRRTTLGISRRASAFHPVASALASGVQSPLRPTPRVLDGARFVPGSIVIPSRGLSPPQGVQAQTREPNRRVSENELKKEWENDQLLRKAVSLGIEQVDKVKIPMDETSGEEEDVSEDGEVSGDGEGSEVGILLPGDESRDAWGSRSASGSSTSLTDSSYSRETNLHDEAVRSLEKEIEGKRLESMRLEDAISRKRRKKEIRILERQLSGWEMKNTHLRRKLRNFPDHLSDLEDSTEERVQVRARSASDPFRSLGRGVSLRHPSSSPTRSFSSVSGSETSASDSEVEPLRLGWDHEKKAEYDSIPLVESDSAHDGVGPGGISSASVTDVEDEAHASASCGYSSGSVWSDVPTERDSNDSDFQRGEPLVFEDVTVPLALEVVLKEKIPAAGSSVLSPPPSLPKDLKPFCVDVVSELVSAAWDEFVVLRRCALSRASLAEEEEKRLQRVEKTVQELSIVIPPPPSPLSAVDLVEVPRESANEDVVVAEKSQLEAHKDVEEKRVPRAVVQPPVAISPPLVPVEPRVSSPPRTSPRLLELAAGRATSLASGRFVDTLIKYVEKEMRKNPISPGKFPIPDISQSALLSARLVCSYSPGAHLQHGLDQSIADALNVAIRRTRKDWETVSRPLDPWMNPVPVSSDWIVRQRWTRQQWWVLLKEDVMTRICLRKEDVAKLHNTIVQSLRESDHAKEIREEIARVQFMIGRSLFDVCVDNVVKEVMYITARKQAKLSD